MQIKGVVVSLALATLAAAQGGNVAFTSVPTSVEPGQPVTVTYEGDPNQPATIILRKGDPGNLATVETITTTATGGSFQWTPPSDGAQDYALEIRQGGTINYSGQIAVAGEASNPIASAASSAASSIVSSVSASATSASASVASSIASSVSEVSSSASSAISSVLASVSSALNATMTSTTAAASATGTGTTMSRNTTMASPTLSATSTETEEGGDSATATEAGAESTASGTGAPNSNSAPSLASPLALVLGAVAAMIYLN